MGRDIQQSDFTRADFAEFRSRLDSETARLLHWLATGRGQAVSGTCGLELEACLVDQNYQPAPENARFIENLKNPLIVPELAKFNFEINTPPFPPDPVLFSALEHSLSAQWQACARQAAAMNLHITQIGILPTLRDHDLNLANVSALKRYHALNQQILKGRRYQPFRIDICGEHDQLTIERSDVMTEAATTSLQIHIQTTPERAVEFYNASLIASAVMVAATANSPLLFGKKLWQETRIPLFEQSVALPCFLSGSGPLVNRVSFGKRYLQASIAELFIENRDDFPILLPVHYPSDREPFAHLQLHNGTIWRWNRPLLHVTDDGVLQLRIEHRVIAAGPTITDDIANIALFYGLMHYLSDLARSAVHTLPFTTARQNFYNAARDGLNASVRWLDGRHWRLRDLLLQVCIPAAKATLTNLGFETNDIEYYLDDVISRRVESGRTGAQWQLDCFHRNGGNTTQLLAEYIDNQERGPVHQWH